jgi:hypothetical protein
VKKGETIRFGPFKGRIKGSTSFISYDPLRDEGELYAEKLSDAGVEVTLKREEGLIHGFFNLFSIMGSKEDIQEIYDYIGSFLLNNSNLRFYLKMTNLGVSVGDILQTRSQSIISL